jgi:hypothetical protein
VVLNFWDFPTAVARRKLGFTVANRRNLGMGMNTGGVLAVLHEQHEDDEIRDKERMREKEKREKES